MLRVPLPGHAIRLFVAIWALRGDNGASFHWPLTSAVLGYFSPTVNARGLVRARRQLARAGLLVRVNDRMWRLAISTEQPSLRTALPETPALEAELA